VVVPDYRVREGGFGHESFRSAPKVGHQQLADVMGKLWLA